MPLTEFLEIIKIFNEFKEKEQEAMNNASGRQGTSNVKEARMSGTEVPNVFE